MGANKVDLGPLYRRFYEAYKNAHPEKANKENQVQANVLWKKFKTQENVVSLVEEQISLFLKKTTKNKVGVLNFFTSWKPSTSNISNASDKNDRICKDTNLDFNKENQVNNSKIYNNVIFNSKTNVRS